MIVNIKMKHGINANDPAVTNVKKAMGDSGFGILEGPCMNATQNCVIRFKPIGIKPIESNALMIAKNDEYGIRSVEFDRADEGVR